MINFLDTNVFMNTVIREYFVGLKTTQPDAQTIPLKGRRMGPSWLHT